MNFGCALGIAESDRGDILEDGHLDRAVAAVKEGDERPRLHGPVGDGPSSVHARPLRQHLPLVHSLQGGGRVISLARCRLHSLTPARQGPHTTLAATKKKKKYLKISMNNNNKNQHKTPGCKNWTPPKRAAQLGYDIGRRPRALCIWLI